jgi:hypothetical protein
MLPTNNSNPCGRPKNLNNIRDLLDFPTCPSIKPLTIKLYGYLPFVIMVSSKQFPPIMPRRRYNTIPTTNMS